VTPIVEINARFFTYPLIERATLYALLQNARVPIEIVGEEEILEDDALSRYRLLFVVDPHVDSRVQTRIRDWVAGGGVLWAGPAAAAWHEFHEPSDILLDTLGLAQRPAPPPLPRETIPNSGAPVLAEGSNAFYGGPFTFRAAAAPPPFTPGAAEVLASFADGRPAILRHRFGKGQAFFHAFPAASLTDGYGRFIAEGPEADACRRLLRTPAEVAGVRPQVESDSSDLLAFVRDGTDFSLVVLANGQNERPVQDARIRVSLPFRPASVTDGQGAAVAFEADSDSATFRVSFAPRWGSIYLIRR